MNKVFNLGKFNWSESDKNYLPSSYVEKLLREVKGFAHPKANKNFNLFFMPPPGFPEVFGIELKAGDQYSPSFFNKKEEGVCTELSSGHLIEVLEE